MGARRERSGGVPRLLVLLLAGDACGPAPRGASTVTVAASASVRDTDRDGVPDARDRCPIVPEDLDGDDDTDGCPESVYRDRDGDGVDEPGDRCPDDPEDRNGVADDDGCPESPPRYAPADAERAPPAEPAPRAAAAVVWRDERCPPRGLRVARGSWLPHAGHSSFDALCGACHPNADVGRGPRLDALNWSEGCVRTLLRNGHGGHLGTGPPTEALTEDVIAYLRALGAVRAPRARP